MIVKKKKHQSGHLGGVKNFAGSALNFGLWCYFYFKLPRGEEEYTVILLVLRAVRASSCPVSGQGNESSWGLLGLQFCMMPRWQQRCTRPVRRLNAWASLLDAPHETRPWGGCNQLLLPCTSVLPVLSFISWNIRTIFFRRLDTVSEAF